MALTTKQEQFAQCIALKGMDAVRAYSVVYNTEKINPAGILQKAEDLASRAEVVARIKVLKDRAEDAAVKKGKKSLDDEITACDVAIENARARGQVAAEVAAIKLRAQLGGHLVEKKEISNTDLTVEDVNEIKAIRDELRERLKLAKDADALVSGPPPAPRAQVSATLRRVVG